MAVGAPGRHPTGDSQPAGGGGGCRRAAPLNCGRVGRGAPRARRPPSVAASTLAGLSPRRWRVCRRSLRPTPVAAKRATRAAVPPPAADRARPAPPLQPPRCREVPWPRPCCACCCSWRRRWHWACRPRPPRPPSASWCPSTRSSPRPAACPSSATGGSSRPRRTASAAAGRSPTTRPARATCTTIRS